MATVERPKAGELEERTVSDTLAVEGKKIRGRIPYSVESRAMPGGWREVIEPGGAQERQVRPSACDRQPRRRQQPADRALPEHA
jgi:hypothetical protein